MTQWCNDIFCSEIPQPLSGVCDTYFIYDVIYIIRMLCRLVYENEIYHIYTPKIAVAGFIDIKIKEKTCLPNFSEINQGCKH